ncbi:hypothetical protein [Cryptosporangium sp. NPDC048952]
MEHVTMPPFVAALFGGEVILGVPSVANRHGYKKENGSSDTNHTSDEIKD